MHRFTISFMFLLFASSAAYAQDNDAEDALISAFMAEHEAWEEDLERWKGDHDEAMEILRTSIDRFEAESILDAHESAMEDHGETLRSTDLAGLAGRHARVRSAHEELREAHHHLMDAVAMLETAIDEDMGPASAGDAED